MKKILVILLGWMLALGAMASETVVWKGSQRFTDWGSVLNLGGSKFSQAKVDDVLRFSITARDGAMLQVSYGSSWVNFDGLESMSVNGDYEMLISSSVLSKLKQGIHIKGVNYTLTAVTLVSNDGSYTTASSDLFEWSKLVVSGGTRGASCTVGMSAYSGAGWYWPEPVDLSGYGSVEVELLQPAAEALVFQVLYGDTKVKRQNLAKGSSKGRISLSSVRNAYSVNLISQKPQTLVLGRVDLLDKQGNVIPSGVKMPANVGQGGTVEYYNLAGELIDVPQKGVNIRVNKTTDGHMLVRKIIVR